MAGEADRKHKNTFVDPMMSGKEQTQTPVLPDLSGDVEIEIYSRHCRPIATI